MSQFDYPLNLRFKLVALAPRIIVTDAKGREVLFISQKVLKLKEDIRIYRTQQKEQEIFNIRAEKILDFDTRYNFYESTTQKHLGSVKAKAWRTIWRAVYQIDEPLGDTTLFIREDNPWVKVADTLVGEIPVVGMFTGFMLHPAYTAYRGSDTEDMSHPVMRLTKENGFFEGVYTIDLEDQHMEPAEEIQTILSFMLMVQFMRRRG